MRGGRGRWGGWGGRVGVALLLSATAMACADAGPAVAQEMPPLPAYDYEGAIETGLLLRRLGQTARVLHVGAHPDDENTALLSTLALGSGADVAYLSLTRGEGGQNGIGPELGTALGLIRTEELLAARRLDGATQYFTRAIDFGFSKNAAETFTHWPKDSVLADVVAVIRHFRPDVVVSAWSGTRLDGHGQHEASGILAREAVLAAGDPARFPEQIEAGLPPHAVAAYAWSARYGSDGPDVELNTGALDPLLGRSYHQVAMASRSRHRSQDMGVAQTPGPRRTAFDFVDPTDPPDVAMRAGGRPARQLEGAATIDRSMFTGLDTLLSQRAERAGLTETASRLRDYEAAVARGELRRASDVLRTVADELGASGTAAAGLEFHLRAERSDLWAALLATGNVRLDLVATSELVVPGQTFGVELSAWNGGDAPIEVRLALELPDGWTTRERPAVEWQTVAPGDRLAVGRNVVVPRDADWTRPYFLVSEPKADGALYDWPAADGHVPGAPFAADVVRGAFDVRLGEGIVVPASRAARFVGVDARGGEFRRPVRVVPPASVSVSPALAAVSIVGDGHRAIEFAVTVRSDAPGGVEGRLRPAGPEGWRVEPRSIDVTLAGSGAEETHRFTVTPPAGLEPGEYHVGALLEGPGCGGAVPECAAVEAYAHGYEVIDYPHIAPHQLYRPATARIRTLDVRVADVAVGYVEGVPDGVPDALDDLGVGWEALDERALADGDLSRFDVILAGTRAYELRPDLVAHNGRLLNWARAGGTLISLYNKYPALEGSYAPWPVTIASPHGRVTEEDAAVTVLQPDALVLNVPNRIGPADWEGWVQERGLYFWDTWQGPLTPLLSMHDEGEQPLQGAFLVAPLGEGVYVYNALALFRQLPEGVPGAYRLLANMLSLGAAQ